jgi:nascent polypeptide-associated complex subunit beta
MNAEKLAQLKKKADTVRTGGKGTVRRKKKVARKVATTDDKKFQAAIKRLGVNPIPGIEEVSMYNVDGTVRIFKNPKLQAGVSSNTFVVSGNSEVKKTSEVTPVAGEEEQQPHEGD